MLWPLRITRVIRVNIDAVRVEDELGLTICISLHSDVPLSCES